MANDPSNDAILFCFQGYTLTVSRDDLQKAISDAEVLGFNAARDFQVKDHKAGAATTCTVFKSMMEIDPYNAVQGYRDFLIQHARGSVCSILDEFAFEQTKIKAKCRLWLAVANLTAIYKLERKSIPQFYLDQNWTEEKGKNLRALGNNLQKVSAYIREIPKKGGNSPLSLWSIPLHFNNITHIEYTLYSLRWLKVERVWLLLCNPILHFDGEAIPYADFLVVQVERMLKQVRDDPSFWAKLTCQEVGCDESDDYESEGDDNGESEDDDSVQNEEVKKQEAKESKGSGRKKEKEHEEQGAGRGSRSGDKDLTSKTSDSIRGAFKSVKNFLHSNDFENIPQEDWLSVRDTLHDIVNLKSLLNSMEITWKSLRKKN